jgi:hypothetical protein
MRASFGLGLGHEEANLDADLHELEQAGITRPPGRLLLDLRSGPRLPLF